MQSSGASSESHSCVAAVPGPPSGGTMPMCRVFVCCSGWRRGCLTVLITETKYLTPRVTGGELYCSSQCAETSVRVGWLHSRVASPRRNRSWRAEGSKPWQHPSVCPFILPRLQPLGGQHSHPGASHYPLPERQTNQWANLVITTNPSTTHPGCGHL